MKVLIIDSSSLMYRAYYALPPLKTKNGELVNAVHGFFSLLIKAVNDFNPDYVVTAFDLPAPTFRHEMFKEYKATRSKTPEELVAQIPIIKEGVRGFDIPVLEKEGFEADDVIGTAVSFFNEKDFCSVVVSGDMDVLQLVDEKTTAYLFKRGIKDAGVYDSLKVQEIYDGLKPEQLIDYKALRGDASDNIPGVIGIGEKTAIELIKTFDSIENIYNEIEKETAKAEKIKKGVLEKLKQNKKEAFLSKELVTIKRDVPLNLDVDNFQWKGYSNKGLAFFEKMELKSLINRIQKKENLTLF
jgi:DNA polymerase-1